VRKSPDYVTDFMGVQPIYEDFARQCADLLRSALVSNDVKYFAIEHRAKSIESFREKLGRSGKSYFDPLHEMTDLAGIRVIVSYLPDVDRVVNLCERLFDIDPENSIRAGDRLGSDEFGYQSTHVIGYISELRNGLDEGQPRQV
jgi:GTP pyrophosphokinase